MSCYASKSSESRLNLRPRRCSSNCAHGLRFKAEVKSGKNGSYPIYNCTPSAFFPKLIYYTKEYSIYWSQGFDPDHAMPIQMHRNVQCLPTNTIRLERRQCVNHSLIIHTSVSIQVFDHDVKALLIPMIAIPMKPNAIHMFLLWLRVKLSTNNCMATLVMIPAVIANMTP